MLGDHNAVANVSVLVFLRARLGLLDRLAWLRRFARFAW
jgi:hypothetical protein